MEKFEKILSLFISNPYSYIQLSDSFEANLKNKFLNIFILYPIVIIIISLIGYFPISEKIKNNYVEFNQFLFLMYFYKYLCFIIPIFYIVIIKKYFHMKYKLLEFRNTLFYFLISFLILLMLLPLSGLFIIENIRPRTIYIYYLTVIILLVIYYFYYKKKWFQDIFINNYNKYKKKVLKLSFGEDSLVGKFQLDLMENQKEKSIFTKIWEFVATIMLRLGLTIPVIAAIFGSGNIKNYDPIVYFCVYMFLFMIPTFAKIITSGVVFNKFIKQIEKEENVTIYNGRVKT